MLELPESHVMARQITETLTGKTIASAQANQSPHGFAWYTGDPALYSHLLGGLTIQSARAVGGQVEIAAQDMRVVLNDGVNIRYVPKGGKLPKKHQLLLMFEDGDAMVCTVQMYGGLFAFADGTSKNSYYTGARDKPTPYQDEFDRAYFMKIAEDAPQNLSVKGLLATEQRIPGLGNGCTQDILFAARLNPQTKLSAIGQGQLDTLFDCVKDVLCQMRDGGGRDIEKDLFGNPGGYKTILSSKTLAYPCPVCGSGITRKAYMGGNVYFCPQCQPV